MKSKVLLLTDGKPGHENQSIALCRHLGLAYEKVTVGYPCRSAKALSYLFDRLRIYTRKLFRAAPFESPEASFTLIVSTGSTSFYPNKVLARELGIPNIAILNPKGYRPDYKAILCPAYDHPPEKSNVIELPLNLCAADASFFEAKAQEFKSKHRAGTPAVGFIIGGPNAISTLDAEMLKTHLEHAFSLTEGCERWVTTSRRTPPEIETLIDALPFDYRLINSRDPYNPVPAFIQLCDRLFITSDSASMISESASFGSAEVEILMNRQLKSPNKFEEFIGGLEALNAVHIFDGALGSSHKKIDLSALLKNTLRSFC